MSGFAEIEDYLALLRTRLLAVPTGSRAEAGLRLELAWTLAERVDSEWGEDADVDQIVEHAEYALEVLERGYEHRGAVLGLAAQARTVRWHRDGDRADLDAAVELWRAHVSALPDDDPDLPPALVSLAGALISRAEKAESAEDPAERAGRDTDLEAGLIHARRAQALSADDPPELLPIVLGYGLALRFDVHCTGPLDTAARVAEVRADRDGAAEQLAALLPTLDEADPEVRYDAAAKLAELLHDRYSDPWPDAPPADVSDLDRAIELLTGLDGELELEPSAMLVLGWACSDRFTERRDPADLEAGIAWLERVLPETVGGLAALVHLTLGDLRVWRAGLDPPPDRRADLHAAMASYRVARDDGDPEWYGCLSAMLTIAQGEVLDGEPTDEELDRIVETGRQAWESLPPGDEQRDESGLLLAVALHDRVPRSERPAGEHLDEISLAIDVLAELEPGYRDLPDRRVPLWALLGMLLAGRGQIRGDAEDLDRALPWLLRAFTELDDSPDYDPLWREVALGLTVCGVYSQRPEELDPAIALFRRILAAPDADVPEWVRGTLGSLLGARARGMPELVDEAVELLRASVAELPAGDPDRLVMIGNLAAALELRFERSRSLEDLHAAAGYRRMVAEYLERNPEAAAMLPGDTGALARTGLANATIVRGALSGDRGLLERGTADLRGALASLPEAHPLRTRMRSDIGMGLAAQGARHGGTERLRLAAEAAAELEAGIEGLPPGHPLRPVVLLRAVGVLMIQGMTLREPPLVRKAIEYAGRAVDESEPASDIRTRAESVRALLLVGLTMLDHDPRHMREALGEFERLLGDGSAPVDPDTRTKLHLGYARALRLAGEHAAARRAGLDAMRTFGSLVLLQSGTGLAFERALGVDDLGDTLVNWCLADGEPAEAVAGLEFGRGLVLHSATVAADIPEMLEGAGHDALAAEWRAASTGGSGPDWEHGQRIEDLLNLAPGDRAAVPSGLHGRVLDALAGTEADVRLRVPPSVAEMAAALTETGADALVYLCPPSAGVCAHGVVVMADGTLHSLPFPLFATELAGAVNAYLEDRARLDRVGEGDHPDEEAAWAAAEAASRRWRRSLELLCDWTWPSVMRPLLRLVSGHLGRAEPPRLVLVPIGALSAIPWHAARRRARRGGPPVYACAEAVISYAASGRQLVDVGRRGVLDLHASPLIVADPTGDLRHAIMEAAELRRRHYGRAHYLGLPDELADGKGEPGEVLARFATPDRPGASMIHFGCHAWVVADRPGRSHLVLADGRELTVDDLLRAATGRDARAPGARISLAACMSDLAGDRHDEALTLATAFLAVGAATVVGARWAIPDETSPLLMVKYHELLNAGVPPRDALRQAQLWMLDPGRAVPDDLGEDLRRILEEEGRDGDEGTPALSDIVGWAAFTHQGR